MRTPHTASTTVRTARAGAPPQHDHQPIRASAPRGENPGRDHPRGRGNARASLLVRDLMTSEPAALDPHDDLVALYDLLDTKHVRHVPVVDRDGDLVGLVTHRDLLRYALGEEDDDLPFSMQRDMLTQKTVGEIMTADPETADPDTDIGAAAQIMLENKYGCMPVVEGSRLVGILTESDFVRYLAERERALD